MVFFIVDLVFVAVELPLDIADISFVDDWLRWVVRRSKPDQEGKGCAPLRGPADGARRSSVATSRGVADGALFRPVNKAGRIASTRLGARSMREIVKRSGKADFRNLS